MQRANRFARDLGSCVCSERVQIDTKLARWKCGSTHLSYPPAENSADAAKMRRREGPMAVRNRSFTLAARLLSSFAQASDSHRRSGHWAESYVKPAVGFSRGNLLRLRSGQALHPVKEIAKG